MHRGDKMASNKETICKTIVGCLVVSIFTITAMLIYRTVQKTVDTITSQNEIVQTLWDSNSSREFLEKK